MKRRENENDSIHALHTLRSCALLAALTSSVALPRSARAEPTTETIDVLSAFAPRPRLLSAAGPREGEGVLGLGLGFFGPLPALELRYVRGLGERAALDAVLSSAGVVQRLRFGARYRLTADDGATHAAIRASVLEAHSFDGEQVIALGVGPGALVSFDEASFTWTLALDAAWSFVDDGGAALLSHRAVQLHPAIGVELPVTRDVEVAIEASTLFTLGEGALWAVPMIGAGLAW